MRKIYSVIIAVLLVLLFINTAHADVENDLTMRVEAGFQKEAQVGSWVPITVYLENNGEKNLKGQVILKQAQRLPVSYTRSVVIAAGAKKN